MVVFEDFEFQLVSAEDDANTPFKEHEKNLKTYVEVEPDAEYFLSFRKLRASSSALYCTFDVDGKSLGYGKTFQPNYIHRAPALYGLKSMSNGISTYTALQFVKASFTTGSGDGSIGIGSSLAGMSAIKMEVYQGVRKLDKKSKGSNKKCDHNSSFTASSITMKDGKTTAAIMMKKNVRSGAGKKSVVKKSKGADSKARNVADDKPRMIIGRGAYLYTITLHYCATPGLIAVGILPKPPLWVHARILHPATTTAKEKKLIAEGVVSSK